MKKAFLLIVITITIATTSKAQDELQPDPENLVPNWSFENLNEEPCLYIRDPKYFTRSMQDWFYPTETHGDIFSTNADTDCWSNPAKGSMGGQTPRTGNVMVGFKTWGLGNTPTFWHEYMMVKLTKPLTIGENYYVEAWFSRAVKSEAASNNISFCFSDTLVATGNNIPLYLQTQVREDEIVNTKEGEWYKISGVFEADKAYEYLIIGNFCSDEETQTLKLGGSRGAYYFMDDVLVKPTNRSADPLPEVCMSPVDYVEIEEKVTTEEVDLPEIAFEVGDTVELSNISFEYDSSTLTAESEEELMKLVYMMHDYPNMEIEIHGHTDMQGEEAYNMQLSQDRAQAVADFLDENKINKKRMPAHGFGETVPLDQSDTEEAHTLNRRVEIIVVGN